MHDVPLLAGRIAWWWEHPKISLTPLILLLFLFSPSSSLYDASADVDKHRNGSTKSDQQHCLPKLVHFFLASLSTTKSTIKIVIGTKISVPFVFGVSSLSRPLCLRIR
jgi:hypothetical protein